MLESIRRVASIPRVPTQAILTAGTLAGFGWLLANDQIHAMLVYLLQLYLTF